MTKLQRLKHIIIKSLIEGTTIKEGTMLPTVVEYPFNTERVINGYTVLDIKTGFGQHMVTVYGINDYDVICSLYEMYDEAVKSMKVRWNHKQLIKNWKELSINIVNP
jgi:hypothetical protein